MGEKYFQESLKNRKKPKGLLGAMPGSDSKIYQIVENPAHGKGNAFQPVGNKDLKK